ncbi:MAG TPA: hypothetical protein VNR62_04155 [Cellulomonas sp.]|nr:hypothetical protein [Cellulomonas sp.]
MTTIDEEIARLDSKARKRRGQDLTASVLLLGACFTVLATWGLGRLTHGWWLRGTAPDVYDTTARSTGDYFLTDWLWGSFVALALLALFLVLRPWSHRVTSVVLGVLIGVGSAFVLAQSLDRWDQAEAATEVTLRTTPYPWEDSWYSCGWDAWTDGSGTVWSVHTGRHSGESYESCSFAVVHEGWREVARLDIPTKLMKRHDGSDPEVSISKRGVATVTMDGARVLHFSVTKVAAGGSAG